MSFDRAFSADGSVIKVFKNTEAPGKGTKLKHLMDLSIVEEDGDKIEPSKMMLFDEESKLVFVDKKDPKLIGCYDLEAGKIADGIIFDEWVNDIANISQNSQLQTGKTIHGIHRQTMFTVDFRNGESVAERYYKTCYYFKHIVANSSGAAVASESGDVRLYSHVGTYSATNVVRGSGTNIALTSNDSGSLLLRTTPQAIFLM
jgi:hypothetical protein